MSNGERNVTHTIGQRLWEILNPTISHSMLSDGHSQKYEKAATELLRGVLTGEIPLPDELVKAGYFVGHINPESIACDALESFEGPFTHHIPDVTK